MAEEKKIADKVMSEDELDGVAGGNKVETYKDGDELCKRGLISDIDILNPSKIRDVIHNLGYKYVDHGSHGGIEFLGGKDNEYFNKAGERITREQFWKNFDAENGTYIVR